MQAASKVVDGVSERLQKLEDTTTKRLEKKLFALEKKITPGASTDSMSGSTEARAVGLCAYSL